MLMSSKRTRRARWPKRINCLTIHTIDLWLFNLNYVLFQNFIHLPLLMMTLAIIVTPVNINRFEKLLIEAHYDKDEINFLSNGFKNGFSIGYMGPKDRQQTTCNVPLKCGSKRDFGTKWSKRLNSRNSLGLSPRYHLIGTYSSQLGLSQKGPRVPRVRPLTLGSFST